MPKKAAPTEAAEAPVAAKPKAKARRVRRAPVDVTKTVAFKAALAAAVAEALKNQGPKVDPRLASPPSPKEQQAIAQSIAERTGIRPPTANARRINNVAGVSLEPRTGWIVCRPDERGRGGLMRVRENMKREPLRVNGHLYEFAKNEWGDEVIQVLHKHDYPAILNISAAYQPYDPPDGEPPSDEEPRRPAKTTRPTPPRRVTAEQPQRSQPQQRATRVTRPDFDPALDTA